MLGAGAMGEVYSAYDPTLDREVAIKIIKGALAESSAGRTRFLREARLAARLHHTHAVTVYSAGEIDNSIYIVMELVRSIP